MACTITAVYQSNDYIACWVAYAMPFKSQIDVAGVGFRPDNGSYPVVVFPDSGFATRWGTVWFRRNKRVTPSLSPSFFTINDVTIEAVE